MKKTDLRYYKGKQSLKYEIDLWCMFYGKYYYSPTIRNGIPQKGKIVDVKYYPAKHSQDFPCCIITLENGEVVTIWTKYGKPLKSNNFELYNEKPKP